MLSRALRRGCARLGEIWKGWFRADLSAQAPPPGRQTSDADTFLRDSFRIGLAAVKVGSPAASFLLPPTRPCSAHTQLRREFRRCLLSTWIPQEASLSSPGAGARRPLQRSSTRLRRGDPSPARPQRPARALGVRRRGGGENSCSSCSNWTNIPEHRRRCDTRAARIFRVNPIQGPRGHCGGCAHRDALGRGTLPSPRSPPPAAPPCLLRCSPAPPAVHTRLSRAGLTSTICTARPLSKLSRCVFEF